MNRKGFLNLAQLILATRVLYNTESGDGGGASNEGNVLDDISKFNDSREADFNNDVDADKSETESTEKTEEKKEEKTEETAEKTDESEEKTEEKTEEEKAETVEDEAEPEPFNFTENADWDTFVSERSAYLETVEVTPELQTILDRQNQEVEAARTVTREIEAVGKPETVVKLMSAVNQMFDVEMVNGVAVPKTKPLVDYLQQNFKKEFSPLAVEMLAAPSMKYRGATMFDEALIDEYGATAEQLKNVTDYLENGKELPVPPPGVRLPGSVHESLKEAWYKLPEIKRFEVEGLTNEIRELEKELNDPDTDSYTKSEIKERLGEKKEKLDVELDSIKDKQIRFNNERAADAARKEFDHQAVQEFVGKVVVAYNTDILGMADAAAADLAPRLTYLDSDAQLGEARDKLARVYSALSFKYDEDGKVAEDPLADYYAKQLKEEGIKFDFEKGRQLLIDHFNTTWKLQHLNETGGSQQAIDLAESKLRGIVADIKGGQTELLGQIAAKRVTSSNAALDKKVKAVREKKQAVRPKIGGEPATGQRRGPDKKEDIDREIKEFNSKREAESSYFDEDVIFDRKKTAAQK